MSNVLDKYYDLLLKDIKYSKSINANSTVEERRKLARDFDDDYAMQDEKLKAIINKVTAAMEDGANQIIQDAKPKKVEVVEKPSTLPTKNNFAPLQEDEYDSDSDNDEEAPAKSAPAKVPAKSAPAKSIPAKPKPVFLVPKRENIMIKSIYVNHDPFADPIICGGKKFGAFHEHLFNYHGKHICEDGYFYKLDENNNLKISRDVVGVPEKYELIILENEEHVYNATAKVAKNTLAKCTAERIQDFDDVENYNEIKDLSFLVFIKKGKPSVGYYKNQPHGIEFYMSCEKANYKDDNPKSLRYKYHVYVISEDNRLVPFINESNGKCQLWGINYDIETKLS